MTDEEKREAAVEKMYDDILDKDGRVLIPTEFLLDYGLHKLYDAGYRKEEEVRKEIGSKIIDMILNTKCRHCESRYSRPDSCCSVGCDDLREMLLTAIKKEFGIEVKR